MSNLNKNFQRDPSDTLAQERRPGTSKRLDTAHVVSDRRSALMQPPSDSAASEESLSNSTKSPTPRATENATAVTEPPSDKATATRMIQYVQTQADQLSEYLGRELKQIDHREAQLHAQTAEAENQVRRVRLWIDQRQQELDERCADLEARELTFEKHQAELHQQRQVELEASAAKDKAMQAAQAELNKQKADLKKREAIAAAALRRIAEHTRQLKYQPRRPAITEKDIARRQHLEESESMLVQHQELLNLKGLQLEKDRKQLDQQITSFQKEKQQSQRRNEAELQKKNQAILRQHKQLESRKAATDRLGAELKQKHHQTLEMLLIIEELWAQLAGTVAPAKLTESIGKLRSRLNDQYRKEKEESDRRTKHLEQLISQSAEQQEKLKVQKQNLQQWTAHRQRQLEEQAARFVTQQQELDRRHSHLDQMEQKWHAERQDHQQHISRLLEALRKHEFAAA